MLCKFVPQHELCMRAGVPALLLFLGMLLLPDSSDSLAERERPDQARRVLERICGTSRVNDEMRNIIIAVEKGSNVGFSLSACTCLTL